MLDRDLAALYGVQTKMFNRAVKRNLRRFPSDFMFQLTSEEASSLRCQFWHLKVRTWGKEVSPLCLYGTRSANVIKRS